MTHTEPSWRATLSRHADLLAPLLLILLLLAVYSYTLLPGVGYTGDTAKFQFLGKILGTPHPTGYPTYILLNHLFVTVFPAGTVAFRANLLSALFASGAVLFLWLTLRLLGRNHPASFFAALLFGLTRAFWSQAIVAEVYTLNALFVAAVTYFFLRWHLHRRDRDFFVACLLYALSFGNHLTMITLLPAIVYLVWATDPRTFTDWRKIGVVALFVLLGAAQYLYIIARSLQPNPLYLETRATTLSELLEIVSGGVYQNQMFVFSLRELLFERLVFFLKSLGLNYHLFPLLVFPGFFKLGRRPLNIFLLLATLGSLFFSLNYNIIDVDLYFIPPYFFLAIYIAFGLQWGLAWLGRQTSGIGWRAAAVMFLLLLVAVQGLMSLRVVSQRGNRHVLETVELLKEYPEEESVLLVDYGYRQYLLYATFVEDANLERYYVVEAFPWGYPDPPTLGAIRDYIHQDMRSEIMDVAPGRSVYCVASVACPQLEEAGVILEPVAGDLYAVVGFRGQ